MLPDPRERPVLSVTEAAALLGVSRASGFRAVQRGEIPSIRIGRLVRVPTAGLLKLLSMEPDDERVEK